MLYRKIVLSLNIIKNQENMKKLIVTITGEAKTGKSTLAKFLRLNASVVGAKATMREGEEDIKPLNAFEMGRLLEGKEIEFETVTIRPKSKLPETFVTNVIEPMQKKCIAGPDMYDALLEVRTFLGHIEPRVGEQAFAHIEGIVEEAIKSAE